MPYAARIAINILTIVGEARDVLHPPKVVLLLGVL